MRFSKLCTGRTGGRWKCTSEGKTFYFLTLTWVEKLNQQYLYSPKSVPNLQSKNWETWKMGRSVSLSLVSFIKHQLSSLFNLFYPYETQTPGLRRVGTLTRTAVADSGCVTQNVPSERAFYSPYKATRVVREVQYLYMFRLTLPRQSQLMAG